MIMLHIMAPYDDVLFNVRQLNLCDSIHEKLIYMQSVY